MMLKAFVEYYNCDMHSAVECLCRMAEKRNIYVDMDTFGTI